MRTPNLLLVLAFAGTLALSGSGRAAGPKFFDDDPISRDPETQDAARVQPIVLSEQFDFVENSFFKAGDRAPVRAVNVNTVDEVPDSTWFRRAATGAAHARGCGSTGPAAPSGGPRTRQRARIWERARRQARGRSCRRRPKASRRE